MANMRNSRNVSDNHEEDHEDEGENMQRGIYYRNKIFVGGLPRKAVAVTLRDNFEKYGEILEAKVVVDETGKSRRYGFVRFKTEEAAEACLSQTNKINGKTVVVGPAVKVKTTVPPRAPIAPVMDKHFIGSGQKYRYKFRELPAQPTNTHILQQPPPLINSTPVYSVGMYYTPPPSPVLSPPYCVQPYGENCFSFPSPHPTLYYGAYEQDLCHSFNRVSLRDPIW